MDAMTNHRVANAGSFFVSSWLIGLFVAPSAPDAAAPAATVAAHSAQHQTATTVQSLLIHGVAGVALIVLALSLTVSRRARLAGAAAGVVSLVQATVGVVLSQHIAVAEPATAAAAFDVVNVADTVKLLFAGAFIWLATRDMGPRMRTAGAVIAPLQAVAGLAFVTGSAALYGLLYLALPALLGWVGVLAYQAWRPAPAARIA